MRGGEDPRLRPKIDLGECGGLTGLGSTQNLWITESKRFKLRENGARVEVWARIHRFVTLWVRTRFSARGLFGSRPLQRIAGLGFGAMRRRTSQDPVGVLWGSGLTTKSQRSVARPRPYGLEGCQKAPKNDPESPKCLLWDPRFMFWESKDQIQSFRYTDFGLDLRFPVWGSGGRSGVWGPKRWNLGFSHYLGFFEVFVHFKKT